MTYAELHCLSNYSFLRGASHPEDLVDRAAELRLDALALTDWNGLYGAVRFARAARERGLRAIVGTNVAFETGGRLVLLAQSREGYHNLCRLLSRTHLDHQRGAAVLTLQTLEANSAGLVVLTGGPAGVLAKALAHDGPEAAVDLLLRLHAICAPGQLFVELQSHLRLGEQRINAMMGEVARRVGVPLLATNGVLAARKEDQPLQDILTCIRERTTLDDARRRLLLQPNAEWHLKSAVEMRRLFADRPEAVEAAARVAGACDFDLLSLRDHRPIIPLPPGETPYSYLCELVHAGIRTRYHPVNSQTMRQLIHELEVIDKLDFAMYFLVAYDIVMACRERGITINGRGSAPNSAVCYALGITDVDPLRAGLLFERFLSEDRPEPPDIDLDIEHERREEVIQYMYETYGREYVGMVCEVISYRARSAVRDVGKALGLTLQQVDRLAKAVDTHAAPGVQAELGSLPAGHAPGEGGIEGPVATQLYELCRRIDGFPRHLSIHVGGMVLASRPLIELAPVEWAAMPNRSIVQWDKDDLADMGFVKYDLLGLGMLTLIRRCNDLLEQEGRKRIDPALLPYDDEEIYSLLRSADTLGVFQVESRAQMAALPRTRPTTFYDIAIQVALIRPGPIQGDMVHPYIRRRRGEERVTYPHALLKPVLERTLGVPLFQEQTMRLAIVGANFSPGQADALRRAMGSKRSRAQMQVLETALIEGMQRNGIPERTAQQVYRQLAAFASYGFPESHALAFALLVYLSAYLKVHYPAQFYCALLNSQPMGFYSPEVIINEAKRRGIEIRPVDVQQSWSECSLEDGHVRLGYRYVAGIGGTVLEHLDRERERGPYHSLVDFVERSRLPVDVLERLAAIGAYTTTWGIGRREALWRVGELHRTHRAGQFPGLPEALAEPLSLREMQPAEEVIAEYDVLGFSPSAQIMELYRPRLNAGSFLRAEDVQYAPLHESISVAGLIVCLQRPPTAKGVVFISLLDETGLINIIVRPEVYQAYRRAIRGAGILAVSGVIERNAGVTNILAQRVGALPRTFRAPAFKSFR